ncbi:MAG: hypothetical protein HRK26_03290 [Rickettsiaceae bacterium H1]|nr:hypothetical protein [Rickettsiaceae bacterium H1]
MWYNPVMDNADSTELQELKERLRKLDIELQELKEKLRKRGIELQELKERIRKHNKLLFIVTLIYTALWAVIFYFTKQGIDIFSQQFQNQLRAKVLLYVLFSSIIAPSVGLVIYSYYYLYHRSETESGKKTYVELEHNEFTKNSSWGIWIKERWEYQMQTEILRKRAACWSIHALSVTAYSGIYYLAVRGIVDIVKNNFPQQEWHNTIIATLSITSFVALSLIDFIFYYSVQGMIWNNVPPAKYVDKLSSIDNSVQAQQVQNH